MSVRPNRNLPPMAEPWGRWSDEQMDLLEALAISLGATADNDSRMGGSAIDNVASQIRELFARQTVTTSVAPLSFSIPNPPGWSSSSIAVALPPPLGGDRIAQIDVSGRYDYTSNSEQTSLFLTGSIGPTRLFQVSGSAPVLASTPPGFAPSIRAYGSILVPEAGATLTLRFQGLKFTTNAQTITAANLVVAVSYGQIVR
jgi:hypothetical protein